MKSLVHFFLFLTFAVTVFPPVTDAAAPNGRFGWYTPHGEVVGDDTSCGPGFNTMELSIKEAGTDNPVTVASAVFLTQNLSGTILAQAQGTGPIIGPICYEPGTQSLGISIDGGAGYYNFEASIVASSSNLIPRGKHIRSVVWLTPTSVATHEYVQESPVNTIININPDYRVRLNSFPNTYGGNALSRGVLFINQWDINTNKVVRSGGARYETALSGGLGTVTFPALPTLPDGRYSWAFYLNLNGSHNLGLGVTELNELKSGLGWFSQYFTLDRTVPQMPVPSHSPAAPANTDAVTFSSGNAIDTHAGFASIRLYVNNVLRSTCSYTGQTSRTCTWVGGPFPTGSTQNYFFVGTDRAGNVATSSINTFTVMQNTLPDLSVANRSPSANITLLGDVPNMFTATVTNSTTTSFTGTTTVRLQIDYNSDNATTPNVNMVVNSGVPLGTFNPGESKDVSASIATIPTGIHRYRFVVDTGSLLDESNEGNNYSPWVRFYVGVGAAVSAVPYVCNQITISWPAIPGVYQYTIMDNSVVIATVPSGVTTYAHRNLAPGSTHVYQVRGDFWGAGSTAYSTGISATAPAACTPDVPDIVAANVLPAAGAAFAGGTNITFTGTAANNSNAVIAEGGGADVEIDVNSDSVIDYRLTAILGGLLGAFNPGDSKNLSANAGIISGTHRYRFRADVTNVVPESEELNNTAPWTTFHVLPSTPGALSASPQDCGTRSINVAWGAVTGASSYTLMDNNVPLVTTSSRTYAHTGLVENSSHAYQIRANNAGGNSAYSAPVVATAPLSCTSFTGTGANSTPPDVEITVSTTSVLLGQTVDVTWDTTLGGVADSCSHSGNYNPSVNWDGGTQTVTMNTIGRASFAIQCSNNSGFDVDVDLAEVDVLSPASPPTLTGPSLAEAGTGRLTWDTNNQLLGGEGVCRVHAGSYAGPVIISNLSNGTGDIETGYADVTIAAQTTFILVCGNYSATTTVQIRPSVIET